MSSEFWSSDRFPLRIIGLDSQQVLFFNQISNSANFFAKVILEAFVLKWILLETYCDLVGSKTPLTFPVHISLLLTGPELANSTVEESDLLVLQKK
jgi:hypothetical protein